LKCDNLKDPEWYRDIEQRRFYICSVLQLHGNMPEIYLEIYLEDHQGEQESLIFAAHQAVIIRAWSQKV